MNTKMLFGSTELPNQSIVNNPFQQNCIETIRMVMRKNLYTKTFSFYASIEFKNGNTSGEQTIDGDNFQDLYKKVYDFCASFENK